MKPRDEAQVLARAINQSAYPVVLTTADLDAPGPEIVYVNDKYTQMTGFSRDELIGATPRIHQGPATDRAELERLKTNLRAGDSFEGCTWNYRKDGTPYQVEWSVTPLRSDSGRVQYFFSVQRDITKCNERFGSEASWLYGLLESAGADRDPVTGALNHWGMLFQFQSYIDRMQIDGLVTAVISLRIKNLERVDQAHGHATLRQLLNDIADRIADHLEPTEALSRSREHIFSILIPVTNSAKGDPDPYFMGRAQAFLAAITEKGFKVAGAAFRARVGAGIARAPADSLDAYDLSVLADEAAGRVCNADTHRVRWANRQTMAVQRYQLALECALRQAITRGELVAFYQPIVDLGTGEVVGAEALARWPQATGNIPIGPAEFIPLAEELGLMDDLGMQIFMQSCRQLREWQQQPGHEAFWMSVNVAPDQLRDPALAERFIAITQAEGVLPDCIKLEITEGALAEGLDGVVDSLEALAATGFPLALDDFGTGYSSLGRFIQMPFSVVKVDRSFVWQTPDGPGAGVVASLSQLSSHLEIYALGEGVETAEHETYLRHCKYDYAQGYYYGKPVAAAEFPLTRNEPMDTCSRLRSGHESEKASQPTSQA